MTEARRRPPRGTVSGGLIGVALALSGCVPAPGASSEDAEWHEVSGLIRSEVESLPEMCHLSVAALTGGPVGETSQIVSPGDRFAWPLREGRYEFTADCDGRSGVFEVDVRGPVSGLEIVVN